MVGVAQWSERLAVAQEAAGSIPVAHPNFLNRETLMDLNHAIEAHARWKLKFRNAIPNEETMDVETISKDNRCELGIWLHGEAKLEFGKLSSYAECVEKHAVFHAEAGQVASAINAKKYTEAKAMIDAGTRFAVASSAVRVALLRLKEDAAL